MKHSGHRFKILVCLFISAYALGFCNTAQIISIMPTESSVVKILKETPYLYVAEESGNIGIYDISNITSPTTITSFQLSYPITTINLAGSILYAAHPEQLLSVIDITNPATPQILNVLSIPGQINDIYANGDLLFCAGSYNGLIVMDVSNPMSISVVAALPTGGFARRLTRAGDYLYIANGWEGIAIVDISNPYSPFIAGQYNSHRFPYSITLNSGLAYIANASEGFEILDVSNPLSPEQIFSYSDTSAFFILHNITEAIVFGNSIKIFDIRNADHPELIGQYDIMSNVYSAIMQDKHFIVSLKNKGWAIINIESFKTILPISSLNIGKSIYSLDIHNEVLYAGTGNTGLWVIDISDTHHPSVIYTYRAFRAWDVKVVDNSLFMTDPTGGVIEMDISNPFLPVYRRQFWGYSGNGVSVNSSGAELYVSADYYGMRILDRQTLMPLNHPDPANFDSVQHILIKDNIAYLLDQFQGILVYDISDKEYPVFLNQVSVRRPTNGRIFGDYLYLACNEYGVYIYDISDPVIPLLIGHIQTFFARDILIINETTALVADGNGGLVVLDISNKRLPQIRSRHRFALYDTLETILFDGNYIYLGYGFAGLMILSLDSLLPKTAVRQNYWEFYY